MTSKEEFIFGVLVVKCLEGSISEPELSELNEILRTDPDAAKIYAEHMFINSQIKLPGNLGSFKVTESDFDTGEFEAASSDSKVAGNSNISLRGVDLKGFMADVDADDADDSDKAGDLLEILELVRTSPAIEIEKPKPVKPKPELIQKVVYLPREKPRGERPPGFVLPRRQPSEDREGVERRPGATLDRQRCRNQHELPATLPGSFSRHGLQVEIVEQRGPQGHEHELVNRLRNSLDTRRQHVVGVIAPQYRNSSLTEPRDHRRV